MNRRKQNSVWIGVFMCVCVFFTGVLISDVFAQTSKSIDHDFLKSMQWRELGPDRGGRVIAISGVVGDPMVYYFGGTGGGIWKTANGGMSWFPVLDNIQSSSVGDIDVSQVDPNIVYAGMGEACLRGNISHGDGVYKSTNAGETWVNVGLKESRQIGRVRIHPVNPDIVFVAALGHVYAPAGEFRGDHGVFRTTDGGKTWKNVLPGPNKTTGAIDLSIDQNNPRIIFAAMWDVFRTSYTLSSGGPGGGIWKSTDSGDTWKRLKGGGLPEGIMGRIGIDVSPANSKVVYAMIESEKGGLYRSTDAGKTWRQMNDQAMLRQRAWYYTHIYADPQNENTVYALNTGMYKSIDQGRTFSRIGFGIHGDHHALWLDPNNPKRMIGGNDGGANVSNDGGYSWTHSRHPTPQFYHVYTDDEIPYNVYGAQQDNSTVKMSSRAFGKGERFYYDVGGGESGHIVPDPRDHNIIYAGSYGGLLTRYNHYTKSIQIVSAWPDNPMGWGAADLKYRFQWTAPIMISKHDPTKLYHAANVLFRSTNEGMSWTQVSSDLTRNDKSKQGPSGGPLTHDNTSVEYYCAIFALAESPLREGLIWIGTDDGLVHLTRDDCKTWKEITPKNMPEWSLISSIEPSHYSQGTCYIAVDRHELDDYNPYAYKTTDFGQSWIPINKGFRKNDFLRVVREDPVIEGILYAGTETGVYYSIDTGESWHELQLNLPNTPIHDLSVKQNDLVAGTHGRGFWILDNLTVLHQLRNAAMDSDMLLKPRDTYNGPQYRTVDVHFFLTDEPKGEVTIEIYDSKDMLARKLSNKGEPRLEAKEGMNRFIWNRQYEGSVLVPGHPMWAAFSAGPTAPPGKYTVKLTNNGVTHKQGFTIKLNPNLKKHLGTTERELQEQFEFLLKIRDKTTEIHKTVLQIRSIKSDLVSLKERLSEVTGGEKIAKNADEIIKKLSTVEAKMLQVKSKSSQDPLNFPIKVNNKIAALAGVVARSYNKPTKQSYDVFEALSTEFEEYKAEYMEIADQDIPKFNRLVGNANIPAIIIKK